jgi:hypothetical protein
MTKFLALIAASTLALPLAAAQETFGAGSQAAPWLKLSNNARYSAMGEAGVALADDVNAAPLNPAGLAQLTTQEASFMHHAYVMDSAVEHIAYGLKAMDGLGLAVGFDYLNFGKIDKYTVGAGNQLVADGSFNPSAMHADLGAGYGFGKFGVGLNAKFVSQSFDGTGGSAFGADLGALWRQGEQGLSLGLALQNVGSQLDGANLPMAVRAGAAYRLPLGSGTGALAGDFSLPSADAGASVFGGGVEYTGAELYSVRAGYKAAGNGGAGGLTLGAGIRYSVAQLDYAFNAVGELGNAHQVSALIKF